MSRFPSLPLFTDAYIADTAHLTNEEHGAYLRLMMFAWRSPECRLPADDRRLALILGVTPSRWARLKPSVMAFWAEAGGFWTQKRLKKEHDFVAEKVEKNRTNGKLGGRPKPLENNNQGKASGSSGETERIAQTEPTPKAPTPTPTPTPKGVPSEVSPPQDAPAEKSADPSPALSLKDRLWIEGAPLLVSMGVPEGKARSMIGRWLRDAEGDAGRILWAIEESRRQATGDPIPYVTRLLNNSPVVQRGRSNAVPSKDGITALLSELDRRSHERRSPGSTGTVGPQLRDGPHDGPPSQRLRGDDAGPILDLEPIRPKRG